MKIRDIKTYVLDAALAEPFAYSQAWYERRGACLVEEPIVQKDGWVDIPDRPGLGIEIDRRALAKFSVA